MQSIAGMRPSVDRARSHQGRGRHGVALFNHDAVTRKTRGSFVPAPFPLLSYTHSLHPLRIEFSFQERKIE